MFKSIESIRDGTFARALPKHLSNRVTLSRSYTSSPGHFLFVTRHPCVATTNTASNFVCITYTCCQFWRVRFETALVLTAMLPAAIRTRPAIDAAPDLSGCSYIKPGLPTATSCSRLRVQTWPKIFLSRTSRTIAEHTWSKKTCGLLIIVREGKWPIRP